MSVWSTNAYKEKMMIDDIRLQKAAKSAAEAVSKNAGVPSQICYAPILWALQDAGLVGDRMENDVLRTRFWILLIVAAVLVAACALVLIRYA